jgi:hypothetical protein
MDIGESDSSEDKPTLAKKKPPVGTGKIYMMKNETTGATTARLNLHANIANKVTYENGQELVILWCEENQELRIKPKELTY